MPLTSSPWMTVVPGAEYCLHTHDGVTWGPFTLAREDGVAGGVWRLHGGGGAGFHGFGLGPVELSVAHWKALAYVVEFLTKQDADPIKAIVWGESDRREE